MALVAPANLLKAFVTSSILAPYLQIDLTAQILNFSNEFDGPIVIISYHTEIQTNFTYFPAVFDCVAQNVFQDTLVSVPVRPHLIFQV